MSLSRLLFRFEVFVGKLNKGAVSPYFLNCVSSLFDNHRKYLHQYVIYTLHSDIAFGRYELSPLRLLFYDEPVSARKLGTKPQSTIRQEIRRQPLTTASHISGLLVQDNSLLLYAARLALAIKSYYSIDDHETRTHTDYSVYIQKKTCTGMYYIITGRRYIFVVVVVENCRML